MKLLIIFGLIIGWFVVGFIINLLVYSGVPIEQQGNSSTARTLHWILNAATIIAILSTLFS